MVMRLAKVRAGQMEDSIQVKAFAADPASFPFC